MRKLAKHLLILKRRLNQQNELNKLSQIKNNTILD